MRWMVETAYSAFKYFGEFASAKVWIYKSLRAVLC